MIESFDLETLVNCVGLLEGTWLDPGEAGKIIRKSGGREEILAHLIKDRKALASLGEGTRALLIQLDSVWTPEPKIATGEIGGPSVRVEPLSMRDAEELMRRFSEKPCAADVVADLLHLSTLRDA